MLPVIQDIDSLLREAKELNQDCCVVYGSHSQYANVNGQTIGAIRAVFRSLFNIPDQARALVKDQPVDEDAILLPGQTLEFRKESGQKSLGNLLTPDQLMEQWGIKKTAYLELVELGLPSVRLEAGIFHPEIAVDEWFKRMVTGSTDTAPIDHASRIHCPPNQSPYLDSEQAAAYLGISVKSLYGQVERRRIVPFRGPKRQYRFTKDMLDEYLNRKETKR